ncbi:MAG TPA: FeoA domain-containing protein [Phycisphaerae bacterium]|nr:FeoA domain-containing protein [Phycisphaerae bacterium]
MSWLGMVIIVGVVGLLFLAWAPGLVGGLRRWRALRQRAVFEDALKHLLTYKHGGRSAGTESLAGALHLPPGRVVDLIARLKSEGLIESVGGELRLTSEGESGALRVVRAHRLWERYLADEAGMSLAEVHRAAERAEHLLTTEQINVLDAHLGHPRHDPHGAPIPDASGELEPLRATSLTDWPVDRSARIIHIDDEPEMVFKQILAQGLRPGQVVRVLDSGTDRLTLTDGDEEYRLATQVAAKIQVVPAPAHEEPAELVRLCDLPNNQPAEVVTIDDTCRGLTRRRLLDLGLTRGTQVHAELTSALGEPRAFQVRGTLITLRREQAALIWVRTNGNGKPLRQSA